MEPGPLWGIGLKPLSQRACWGLDCLSRCLDVEANLTGRSDAPGDLVKYRAPFKGALKVLVEARVRDDRRYLHVWVTS